MIARIRSILRNLVQRDSVERDLNDELRAYVHALAAEKVRAGVDADVARREALIELGGIEQVKENVRDTRAGALADSIARDVKHALRGLRRSPGFAIAVATTLTVGIGLNTSLFTLVYATLARPLPVRDAGRVVNVYQQLRGRGSREVRGTTSWVSYADFQAYATAPAFTSTSVFAPISVTVSGASAPIASELVSCEYFRTTAVRMALGRPFSSDECAHPGSGPVVVLSNALWASQFGSDSSVVGRVIQVNALPLTVVGVAEAGYNGIALQPSSLWLPVTQQPALAHGRDSILVHRNASWLQIVARLAGGSSIDAARTQVASIGQRLDLDYPGRRVLTSVVPGAFLNFPEVTREGRIPLVLTMLLGLTIVVMACANVMNLLLARGLARRREIAIRLAIGAGRRQLVQQLLVESAVLSAIGATIGMSFVLALPKLLAAMSPIGALQIDPSPDVRVLVYAFGVGVVTTFIVGLLPALHATRVDLVSAFKGVAMIGRVRVRPTRLRSAMTGIQVAGSAMLLVLAALFVRGSMRATRTDPGYATHNVVAFSLNLAALGYDTTRANSLYRDLIARIEGTPGVAGVAMSARLPLLARWTETVVADRPAGVTTSGKTVNVATVSGAYFKTMGIHIVRGATFDSASVGNGDLAAVISGSMATVLWPGADPIGSRFKAGGRWYRVVGIASEISANSLDGGNDPIAYLSTRSALDNQIIVRTSDSPTPLILAFPEWLRAVDPQIVVQSERFEDRIAAVLAPTRMVAAMIAALGALALLLAAIGVAGVVSFGLGQRRREIAVRMAVGATQREVIGLMMRQATTPIVAGTLAGVAIAVLVAQVARRLLFGLSPIDPATYAAMILVLSASAALATYLPARLAGRVSPAATLREE